MINNRKVLIVLNDSDPILSRVCKNKFEKEAGWNTIITSAYDDAIKIINSKKPDLLVTDIILVNSDKNGLDLLRAIKESKDNKISRIKVIIFTELEQEGDMKMALQLGAVDYLVKSKLSVADVIIRLEKYIK